MGLVMMIVVYKCVVFLKFIEGFSKQGNVCLARRNSIEAIVKKPLIFRSK